VATESFPEALAYYCMGYDMPDITRTVFLEVTRLKK
jgi:hypothetical protein